MFVRVVATQLNSDFTKRLVLTDPYRIKCPAESMELDFDLPLGVQLLQVYIPNREYCKLVGVSFKNRSVFQFLRDKNIKKVICLFLSFFRYSIMSAQQLQITFQYVLGLSGAIGSL